MKRVWNISAFLLVCLLFLLPGALTQAEAEPVLAFVPADETFSVAAGLRIDDLVVGRMTVDGGTPGKADYAALYYALTAECDAAAGEISCRVDADGSVRISFTASAERADAANLRLTSDAPGYRNIDLPVAVSIRPVTLTAIAVSPETVNLTVGETAELTVMLTPADVHAPVTWTVYSSWCVRVGASGLVTAKNSGSTRVTASVSGSNLSAFCSVTVSNPQAVPEALNTRPSLMSICDTTRVNLNSYTNRVVARFDPVLYPLIALYYTPKITLNGLDGFDGIAQVTLSDTGEVTLTVSSAESVGGYAYSLSCQLNLKAGMTAPDYSAAETLSGLTLDVSRMLSEGDFTYVKSGFSDYAVITGYTGTGGAVVIPEAIGGMRVAQIGDFAFAGKAEITSVIIPECVTSLGSQAFQNCTGIRALTLPDLSSGWNPFWGCTNLKTIDFISWTSSSISSGMFGGCSGLETMTLPDSIRSIGGGAFRECSSLTSITIPDRVNYIGYNAFDNCSSLVDIAIPSYLELIPEGMLSGCSSLVSISIPMNVSSIGNSAFSGCSSLETISIPAKVTVIGGSAFYGCSSIEEVLIPDTVLTIGYNAFDCGSLKRITVPGRFGLGVISGNTCSNIEQVTLTGTFTKIADYAYSGCKKLSRILLPENINEIGRYAFSDCSGLTEINLPASLQTIGSYAFHECTSLTTITIPDQITVIEDGLFSNCVSLLSVKMGDIVTIIKDKAFRNCRSLETISIPDTVTSIGERAFSQCSKLSSVHMPSGITTIETRTFCYCTALSQINLPANLQLIQEYAFLGCEGLTNVEIPAGVDTIKRGAFNGCRGLERVTLPEKLTDIGKGIFANCTALSTLTIPATVKSVGAHTPGALLHTQGHLNNGESAEKGSFEHCTRLKTLTLEEGVEILGLDAFAECVSLKEVVVPETVSMIAIHAFRDCIGLKKVVIPQSAETIHADAFEGCTQIRDVQLPQRYASANDILSKYFPYASVEKVRFKSDVTSIGAKAFTDAETLKKALLPDGVNSVAADAFATTTELLVYRDTQAQTATAGMANQRIIGVDIETPTLVMNAGDTRPIAYSVHSYDDAPVTFASLNPDIATVNQAGVVTALKPGSAMITATIADSRAISDALAVTVSNASIPGIGTILILQPETRLDIHKTVQLMAVILPANLSQEVVWSSSNPSVATVSNQGLVTGLSVGTTVITAQSALGLSTTFTIQVIQPVTQVLLSPARATLKSNKSLTLTASVLPADAYNTDLVWGSSAPDVVEVSNNGVITPVSPGMATVTVNTYNKLYATCAVVVPSTFPGDIYVDETVNNVDVVALLRGMDDESFRDTIYWEGADLNGDSLVDLQDASLILDVLVGLGD